MPLRPPRRLPKQFRRPLTGTTRRIAERYSRVSERRVRRRRERMARMMRRFSQFSTVVASECRIWLIVGLSLAAALSIMILLFAPFFDVRQIHVRRQDPRVDPEEVQEILSPLFRQRLVLLSRNQIQSLLRPHFEDLQSVSIEKEYPSTLKVSIALEPVVAEVMIAEPEDDQASGSGAIVSGPHAYYYLTRSGYFVVSPIALTKTPLPLLTVTDWSIRPTNRSELVTGEFLEIVFRARDTLLRDFGLDATETIVFVRAREVHIKTAATMFWFDVGSPLKEQFQRLHQFLSTLSFAQAKEYIDLRVGDKVVYR